MAGKSRAHLRNFGDMANEFACDIDILRDLFAKKKIKPAIWGSSGVPHLFDPEEVWTALPERVREMAARVRAAEVEEAPPSNGQRSPSKRKGRQTKVVETFQTAKARKMTADANAAELKNKLASGEIVQTAIAVEMILDEYTRTKTKLRALADKIAPSIASSNGSMKTVRAIIADAIDEALTEIGDAADITERLGTAQADAVGDPEGEEGFDTSEEEDGE